MDWPAYSQDLHPSENVWDYIGKQITEAAKSPPTHVNLNKLWLEHWSPWHLISLWRDIAVKDVIRSRGGH